MQLTIIFHGKTTTINPAIPKYPVKSTGKITVKNPVIMQPPTVMQPQLTNYECQPICVEC